MIAVSGFYQDEEAVRAIFGRLLAAGVPRDLIRVLIRKEDETRFFVRAKRRKPSSPVASVGRGALAGLIVFAFLSAGLIIGSGARNSERLTWIMILGPNMGVMVGGLIGFAVGLLKKARLPKLFTRLAAHDGILLVAQTKSDAQAQAILKALQDSHAQFVKAESA